MGIRKNASWRSIITPHSFSIMHLLIRVTVSILNVGTFNIRFKVFKFIIGRTFPSFLNAGKTWEKKRAWGSFISLMMPLFSKGAIKGRIKAAVFPLTMSFLAGVRERGGGTKKFSLRPVVIMLVAVRSPKFSQFLYRCCRFNSQIFCISGFSGETLVGENSVFPWHVVCLARGHMYWHQSIDYYKD